MNHARKVFWFIQLVTSMGKLVNRSTVRSASDGKKISKGLVKFYLKGGSGGRISPKEQLRREKEKLEKDGKGL